MMPITIIRGDYMSISKEDQFINDSLKEMDKEVAQDSEIKDKARYISQLLQMNPVVKVEHNEEVFQLAMKQKTVNKKVGLHTVKERVMLLIAVNEKIRSRAKLMNRPYIPATYTGEYNDEFTENENFIAVVEAFLYHVIGEIKIEKQDDGIAKIAREKDFI